MAHSGGQVGWDDVTIVGKRGPRSGTTLKTQQVKLKKAFDRCFREKLVLIV